MDIRHHQYLSVFFRAQIPSTLERMALCSTTTKTRAAIRPAHPPRPVLAPSFSLCNSRRLGPRPRLEFPHDLRLGTSHRTPIRQSHVPALLFLPSATTCHGVARNAFSTASLLLRRPPRDPLLTLPSPVPSPPLELPPASARPGLSLPMCQVPAETRRPSVPPSWATLQTTVRLVLPPSPPPWYHLTASPAGNPPGSRLVTPSIGQKPPCPIWSTAPHPFRPLSPWRHALSPTSGHIPGPVDHDRRRIILPLSHSSSQWAGRFVSSTV